MRGDGGRGGLLRPGSEQASTSRRLVPRGLGVLLLALGAGLGCPTSAQSLMEKADRSESRRSFPEALAGYRNALRRLGDDEGAPARALRSRLLAHLADLCYLDMSDLHCAVDAYRRLIETYPDAPETFQARVHLAEMLRDRLGDLPGAIAQFKALATAYPGRTGSDDFQYQAAEGYFFLRDYAQARTEARALLERFPESSRAPQARFLQASSYEMEGRRSEAAAAFQELIERTPASEVAPRARLALARLLEQDGDDVQALALLITSLKDDPDPKLVQGEIARLQNRMAAAKALSHTDPFAGDHPRRRGESGDAHPEKEFEP
jgi:TolA-binding protein